MANSQALAMSALGVMVGVVVGASSAQTAQTILLSGFDPNAVQDDYVNPREIEGRFRHRADAGVYSGVGTEPVTGRNHRAARPYQSAVGAPVDDGFEVLDRYFPACSPLYQPDGINRRYWMCIGRARE